MMLSVPGVFLLFGVAVAGAGSNHNHPPPDNSLLRKRILDESNNNNNNNNNNYVEDRSPRIVNGQNAPKGRFPWFTQVRGATTEGGGVDICGGSLIAKDIVITAAHCV
jgi:V8-like Glu-specific endopeptidase